MVGNIFICFICVSRIAIFLVPFLWYFVFLVFFFSFVREIVLCRILFWVFLFNFILLWLVFVFWLKLYFVWYWLVQSCLQKVFWCLQEQIVCSYIEFNKLNAWYDGFLFEYKVWGINLYIEGFMTVIISLCDFCMYTLAWSCCCKKCIWHCTHMNKYINTRDMSSDDMHGSYSWLCSVVYSTFRTGTKSSHCVASGKIHVECQYSAGQKHIAPSVFETFWCSMAQRHWRLNFDFLAPFSVALLTKSVFQSR